MPSSVILCVIFYFNVKSVTLNFELSYNERTQGFTLNSYYYKVPGESQFAWKGLRFKAKKSNNFDREKEPAI